MRTRDFLLSVFFFLTVCKGLLCVITDFFFKMCILFVATCSLYTNCIWKGPCRWFSLSLLCRTGLSKKWRKEEHTLQSPIFLHLLLTYVEHSDQTCWRGLRVGKKIAYASTHPCFVFSGPWTRSPGRDICSKSLLTILPPSDYCVGQSTHWETFLLVIK